MPPVVNFGIASCFKYIGLLLKLFAFIWLEVKSGYCYESGAQSHDYTIAEGLIINDRETHLTELFCHSFSQSSVSCEDLNGTGSFNTTCTVTSSSFHYGDLCIYGEGNFEVASSAKITCPVKGCSITVNILGTIKFGPQSGMIAGTVIFHASSVFLDRQSIINTTALGGPPPPQTTGTPHTLDGAGGGYGGRGASCKISNVTNWGGDVYAWAPLSNPWSYGSQGGSTSAEIQFGGGGGGRVMLKVSEILHIDGYVLAEGGSGGLKGGGGSGGSIVIDALKMIGNGTISVSGGSGWGGGGGGRMSLNCYSVQPDILITAHGGYSVGCTENAGAAGTIFDSSLRTLHVSNNNLTTQTETPLLGFPVTRLWSNVLVECNAKLLVPLLWTRLQVTGQIRVVTGGSICFGLSDNPVSEFEMVAEELLISDSVIKVYGALRMYVKMLLMWNSKIQIDGGSSEGARVSMLEARNLVVLKHQSVIASNVDLGVYGQGLLNLTGDGDGIRARRLFLSLFYNIAVGPGSFIQAPFYDDVGQNMDDNSLCDIKTCPSEIIMPTDDCHMNSSLSSLLQICGVENLTIGGLVKGSIVHFHRARILTIQDSGTISASELGCSKGFGKGKFVKYGAGGGAGHGGKGGSGFNNEMLIEGGQMYGDAYLPCELGSGSGDPSEPLKNVVGGGLIVIGSFKWPLSMLEINGSLSADGQNHSNASFRYNGTLNSGLGGGSGGSILLYLQSLVLHDNSSLSVVGGNGGPNGGGGGAGGRIHFHWSNIAIGDEYVQIASVNGTLLSSGGTGYGGGYQGDDGTITGKMCPVGLYGTFCNECPVGTYKDVIGSNSSLCTPCSLDYLPQRANFIYVRGGVTQSWCPYKCISDKYSMPNCYTPLEELVYTLGGPWLFSIFLSVLLILLALLLSIVRAKLNGGDYTYHSRNAIQSDRCDSFPFLLSLAEVPETSRVEETQSHVHRMYFMGPNTFREPWHLPYSPPDEIIEIVYEDAFNRFIDEINLIASYEWWEGSVHSILSVVAFPCAWSWKQWRRRKKIHCLQDYVKSKYDHSCLRSCRSRALYKGLKVGFTPDLMVAYIDFFLGGDEKRLDVVSTIQKRFPMCLIFGGDGSFMSPYFLDSDPLLTNLLGQYVSTAIWKRLVAGLNAQLRTVRRSSIRTTLAPVISWISSHGNPRLQYHGIRIEVGWFQATASGHYQLGVVVAVSECFYKNVHLPDVADLNNRPRRIAADLNSGKQPKQNQQSSSTSSRKRLTGGVNGGILNEGTLKSLDFSRDFMFPFSLLLQNTRPIGFEDTLQTVMCLFLLADFAVTILTLVQFYWISVAIFFAVLFIPPLSLFSPFLAGLNAIFSRGPKRSSLSRVYALWNATSVVNIVVAITCGTLYSFFASMGLAHTSSFINEEGNDWWVLPIILFLMKSAQAGLFNWHIANIEITDQSLFSPSFDVFWAM